jgi:AraC-like DNA-binding protein
MFDIARLPFASSPRGASFMEQGGLASLQVDLVRAGLGSGHLTVQSDGQTLVNIANARFDHPLHDRVEVADDTLLVRASLGACVDYRCDDLPGWRFCRPEVTVAALPRGTRLALRVDADAPLMVMSVALRPRTLVERHQIALDELPAPLRALVGGRLTAPALLASLPIGADVAALVRDLAHSRLTGSLRRTQLQARAAELLVLVAAGWRERLGHESWPGARPRDAELLAAARRVLGARFADPPTLAELATMLGTNKNKLNQLFRDRLQVTPQAYCLRLRIEHAQALIAQGRMNLAQVADAVGYQHQSSFTAAFRDATGLSPGRYAQLARQGAAPRQPLH